MARPKGNHADTIRCINAVSRLGEAPAQLMIELCPEGFRSHGATTRPAGDAVKDLVSVVLPMDEQAAVSLDSIVDITSQPRATVQRVLGELKGKGQVIEVGRGARGDPYRYYRAANDSAQTPSL
jgi:hypothetical protein